MSKKIDNRVAIEREDLLESSSVRKYPLGLEVKIQREDMSVDVYIYLQQAFSNATAYNVQDVFAGFTTVQNIGSGQLIRPVVPQIDVPNGNYAFYQISGTAKAFVEEVHAESIDYGSNLKIVAAATGFRNNASNSLEPQTCAVALEELDPGTDGNISVYLWDKYVVTS